MDLSFYRQQQKRSGPLPVFEYSRREWWVACQHEIRFRSSDLNASGCQYDRMLFQPLFLPREKKRLSEYVFYLWRLRRYSRSGSASDDTLGMSVPGQFLRGDVVVDGRCATERGPTEGPGRIYKSNSQTGSRPAMASRSVLLMFVHVVPPRLRTSKGLTRTHGREKWSLLAEGGRGACRCGGPKIGGGPGVRFACRDETAWHLARFARHHRPNKISLMPLLRRPHRMKGVMGIVKVRS